MHKELCVDICESYEENNLFLYPDPNNKVRYLYLAHRPVNRKVIRSININGDELLIVLNAQNKMASLDINIYREDWIISNKKVVRPHIAIKGNIEFLNLDLRINMIDESHLRVYTNKSYSAVKIEIGDYDRTNSSWIALSKYCVAELIDNHLVGFWIDISDY